jgi:hypothetical protein
LKKIPGGETFAVTGDAGNMKQILKGYGLHQNIRNVVMRGVVHHLSKPEKVFGEIFNALSATGKLIVLEGNASSRYRNAVLAIADLLGIQHEASLYPHIPPEGISTMLANLGFSKISIDYLPGILAPAAYAGIGDRLGNRFSDFLDSLGSKMGPKFFGWWFLLQAEKTGAD